MPERIPALTVWQPWATLIAAGAKPFEFRSWPAPARLIGKRIAIHAGMHRMSVRELKALCWKCERDHKDTGLCNQVALPILEHFLMAPADAPLGSVLCIATLGTPICNRELEEALGLPHVNDSDRIEHSNWGWPLTDIEVLSPFIPARGFQGFWTWTRADD